MTVTFFKKVLAVFFAVCLLSAVGGCSSPKDSNTSSSPDNNTASATKTDNDTYEKDGIIYVSDDTKLSPEKTVAKFGDFSSESDNEAIKLRKEIMDTKDTIKAKGTTWYLSNDGDDSNDGKSPEKAWKTVNALVSNEYRLQAGDAVLFNRGDIFRGNFNTVSGVSYGAYGNGDKPVIYGCKKNYADDVWRRTSEENIYALIYTSAADVGMIIFNHGEAHGNKKIKSVFDCQKDYDFYHDAKEGVLYVYCSKGKPSDAFYDIELLYNKSIISVKNGNENVYIENLCLKYTGAFGISVGMPVTNISIKGCEIGWIGGSIHKDVSKTRYGNGIQFYGQTTDAVVDHCWIYQCYDAGFTHQYTGSPDGNPEMNATNISYTSNLVEFCNYSLEYFWNWKVKGQMVLNPNVYMKDILVANNIMRFSGYGICEDRPDPINMAHIATSNSQNYCINFVIKDNVFDTGKLRLFAVRTSTNSLPTFSNNTYIQKAGGKLGIAYINGKNDTPELPLEVATLKTFDKNGKLIIKE